MMERLHRLSIFLGFLLGLLAWVVSNAQADPSVLSSDYRIERLADGLGAATGLALSPSGDLYISDDAGFNVFRILAPSSPGPHSASVYVAGIPFPNDLTFAFGGRLFVTSSTSANSPVLEVLSDRSLQTFATGFSF